MAFVQGLLCGAQKLTHVAYLRRDPVVAVTAGGPEGLRYIVVARLMSPLRKLIVKGMDWQSTGVAGVTVAEILHQEKGWSRPRRLVVVRHEIKEKIQRCPTLP